MSITLLCLVKGNTTANAFPVDIEKDQLVGHLKKVIKAEQPQTFANVDAKDIKLWKVTIPDDLIATISKAISHSRTKSNFLQQKRFRNTFQTHLPRNIFMS